MSNSLILRSPAIPTYADRPKAVRDPMVRPGTKFLFDLTRPKSHPGGAITTGSMTGKTVTDLSGNSVPLVFPSNAGWTCNADGSVSNTAGADPASIGSGGQFNMAAAPFDFLATYWFSITTGYLASSTAFMFHLTHSTPTVGQFAIYLGGGGGGAGRRPTVFVATDSAGAAGVDITLDEPHMIAVHRSFSAGTLSAYIDGVKQYTISAANTLTATSNPVTLAGTANRKTYRMSLVDLETSAAEEAAQGYNPNAILDADAHVLQEWRFCKGLIAEAPRTAFT